MTYPYAPPPSNVVSPDYFGSSDQYILQAAQALAEQYASGTLNVSETGAFTTGTGGIGQPNGGTYGSGTIDQQSWNFWLNYTKAMAANNDPGLTGMFGTPPTRSATYVPDPDSQSALDEARRKFDAGEAALDRAQEARLAGQAEAGATARTGIQAGATVSAAQIGASAQIESTRIRADTDWKIASLDDATRRYIAEGDWGVQKYIAELQETGMMTRFQLELGFKREELAQRALEEKNRHGEQMTSLALEVAKYDAELAASPRNWLKYAAWLRGRNIIVNGLSLAMAAQEVPDDAISPASVAEETGSNLAGVQTAQEIVSGRSGGSTSPQDPFGAQTAALTGPGAGTTQQQLSQYVAPPSAEELGSTTDYSALAQKLLGMNPALADPTEASAENLQQISNQLKTSTGAQVAPFQAWAGPTVNALGVDVGSEVSGQGVDYRKFVNALAPSEQQMKLGEVESIRGEAGVADWLSELDRSRPKGRATFSGGGYG